jgi:UDP-glucose 4-epimerase
MAKYSIKKIVFSLSAIVCNLNAKLLCKQTNPSSNTKLFIEQIQTNDWKSDNTWNVLLPRSLNAIGAHENDLMWQNRNTLVLFFAEIGVGNLPELGVFGNDYHTVDVTKRRDYIDVVDVPQKCVWAMAYCLRHPGVKAVKA